MTKYIELIDKYEIRQSDPDEYNPPSYIWTDNTGELIRCEDCKYRNEYGYCTVFLNWHRLTGDFDYCSDGERKEE